MIAALPRIVRNKEIMLRSLEGQSLEAIAEVTNLEPQAIRNILNSDAIKPELLRLQGELGKDIVQKVKARSHAALETVTDVMNGELFSELRFKAASKLLDLNPDLKPKQDDVAGAIGAGLGEYIIRELAKRKRESEEERNGRFGRGKHGEGENEPLGAVEIAGDDSGSQLRIEESVSGGIQN